MKKQGRVLLIIAICVGLSGCISTVWTGANTIYDRHSLYKKFNDYQLIAELNKVLATHKSFEIPNCVIDMAAFNGDILLAGHIPSLDLFEEFQRRINSIKGYRRLFNRITLKNSPSNNVQDTWITTQIRTQIFADSSIDPKAFKVVTSDRIVYLMGDVPRDQAEKVVQIARYTYGVQHVVKIFRYYTYQVQ